MEKYSLTVGHKSVSVIRKVAGPHEVSHENGHIAGLHDEYTYIQGSTYTKSGGEVPLDEKGGINCVYDPEADIPFGFKSQSIGYGDKTPKQRCADRYNRFKPSSDSVMENTLTNSYFNVVSCSYILYWINKGYSIFKAHAQYKQELDKYLKDCMNPEWNTIKPIV